MSATNQFPPRHLISDNHDTHDPYTESHEDQEQLALPSKASGEPTQQINVSNSEDVKHTIKFDDLGPLVINKDGTLSRIHNWADMNDAERERTVRVLGKRNILRKEAILKDEESAS